MPADAAWRTLAIVRDRLATARAEAALLPALSDLERHFARDWAAAADPCLRADATGWDEFWAGAGGTDA